MMLFKISFKNMKRSFRDYAVYFLTLILGVTIFYLFNSMDSQTAMMQMSSSKKEIVKLLLGMLSGVSVFVALILGFLIVYANNFLMKRRKREFGLYMLLGMGRGSISGILIGETFFIGLISLAAGLLLGVFGSQLMSVIVAKMFEADMSGFTFVFSETAAVKTMVYFGIMYVVVIVFNLFVISRVKLITLFHAKKTVEKIKTKNPMLVILVWLFAVGLLGYAYFMVTQRTMELNQEKLLFMIFLGCVGTYLFFWSLSGCLLQFMKMKKGFYYKNLNMFVARQLNSQINTNIISMTIICLMLFVTISVLSCGTVMNESLRKDLKEMTPRDVCFVKYQKAEEGIKVNGKTAREELLSQKFDVGKYLKHGMQEATVYQTKELLLETSFASCREEVEKNFPMLLWDMPEDVVSLSDYNALAGFYGEDVITLGEGQFAVVCSFESMKNLRELSLGELEISIDGKTYRSAFSHCLDGYLVMSNSHTNIGVYVLPDSAFLDLGNSRMQPARNIIAADYQAETDAERQAVEKRAAKLQDITVITKISLYESSTGLSAVITFLAMYLGVIFLISGAALLALKQLSDSTDNRERYQLLRRLGTEEKMIHRALLEQIGIFFFLPLFLAVVHSVFGIWFAGNTMRGIIEEFRPLTLVGTGLFLVGIYGAYFLATYLESRRMIDEQE